VSSLQSPILAGNSYPFRAFTDSPVLPEICEILDFRQSGDLPAASRGGGIFHRALAADSSSAVATAAQGHHRDLQFDGERCTSNVLDAIRKNPDLSVFANLLKAANLEDLFLCAGPFTALVPTNAAFEALDPAVVNNLLRPENVDLLQEILLYHLLPGYQPSDTLAAGKTETLLFGSDVNVTVDPLAVNGAKISTPDIAACNGVIHPIDDVLMPGASDVCDAFNFTSTRRRLQDGGANCNTNVLETARGNPDLSTVVGLIDAAGLDDIFSCAGPFTALLPNNAAFDALDPATLDSLLDPAHQNQLQDLLLYHILPGATKSTEFTAGPTTTLLMSETLDTSVDPLQFDGVGAVIPDIPACNGLIDVVNSVLFPVPMITPTDAPFAASAQTDAPSTLVVASTDAPVAAGAPSDAPVAAAAPTDSPVAAASPTDAPASATAPTDAPAVAAVPTDAPAAATSPTDAPAVAAAPTGSPMAAPSDAPAAAGPTQAPSAKATSQTVRVTDYYIAFVAGDGAAEPTAAQYDEILKRTNDWFKQYFTKKYANDPKVKFLDVKSELNKTAYKAGIPEARFNILMDFSFSDLSYTLDSTPPTADETFKIMRSAITPDYILQQVRTLDGSPFALTTEVFMATSAGVTIP
jgi:uncharacterized surface protein with fasciclin (FAS1) repeats